MNFDTALEMAIISSWDDLMKADDHSSLHVEYDSPSDAAVESVQVWSVGPHGTRSPGVRLLDRASI